MINLRHYMDKIDQTWKIDDLFFVGMLQADAEDNKEIINSAVAIENGSLLNRIIDSNAPSIKAVPTVSDFNNVCELENATDQEQTYTVTISTTERTPADWSAQFVCGTLELTTTDINDTVGQIVVPANSTAEFVLTLKVGSTLGLGDTKVFFDLEGTPTIKRSRMTTAVTTEIEKLLLETGTDYSMRPYIDNTDHNDIIILDPADYLAFADKMTNVKLIIWNKGPSDGLSADEIDTIKNTEDVNHFICGDGVISSLVNPDNLSYFDLEWIGWNLEAQGPTYTIWVSGQQGDVITGELGGNIEVHFQNDGYRKYNDVSYFVAAEDAIFGVRSIKNNNRTVLLGMSPYTITNENIRRTLIKNVLDWLVGDKDGQK